MKATIEERNPKDLKNHHDNIGLYGDKPDQEFIEKVAKHGITTPLTILPDNTVVCGHRRRQAAMINKMKTVPVFVRHDLSDPLDIQELLVLDNAQRVKTTEQKAREYKLLKEIEAERAKGRQSHGETAPGKRLGENSPKRSKGKKTGKKGKSSDAAAEKVGMSSKTAEKAAKVVDAIDEAEAAGDTEKADQLRGTLNKNVSAAHREAQQEPGREEIPEDDLAVLIPNWAKGFDRLSREFTKLLKEAEYLGKSEGGEHLDSNRIQELTAKVKSCQAVIKACKPAAVCPYCEADIRKVAKCDPCRGAGYVTKVIAEAAPRK